MTEPKSYYQQPRKAEAYKTCRRPIPAEFVRKITDFLSKTFDPSDCDAVDVGCGSGQATLPLASVLHSIVGIEVSQAQLDQLDRSVLDNVRFQLGESSHIPFDDHSLHLVNVKSALHWFDIPKFFQEVDRVLRPGGVLAASHGGGTFHVVGHEEEARQLMRQMLRTKALDEEKAFRLQLVRTDYKDIDFPYKGSLRKESLEEIYVESVANVVRLWTCMGGFDGVMEEGPKRVEIILKETQDKLMALLGLTGNPEETNIRIKYEYSLFLCRKPL